jgi:putative nucleotidyltransferase with HDIG domain
MTTGEIEDLTGQSKDDIKKGILRGHPKIPMDKTFEEDPLRMIRLFRFQAKYDWDIPMAVLHAVKRKADRITIISSERIMEELKKIMELGKLKQTIKLMSATGLLKHILPEIEALKGVKQNLKWHTEGDAYKHTLMVLKEAPPGVDNQIAALLHDVGKATTTSMLEEEIHSYGHEDVGADIAEAVMKRLKFDNDTTSRVKKMVKNHMRPHHLGRGAGPKALRKFIRDVGDELVDSILALARADELGKIPSTHDIPDLIEKIKKIREESKEKITEKTILNGKEIMDLLDIPTGVDVGRAKKMLIDLEDEYAEKGEELTKETAKKELLKSFIKKASITNELRRISNIIQN